jgi:hypothetical protein
MSANEEEGKAICILSFGMPFKRTREVGATYLYCADSGGPGMYSQLLILKEFMRRLAHDLGVAEDEIYPADHFDLMGGVGFGGCAFIDRLGSCSHIYFQLYSCHARASEDEREPGHCCASLSGVYGFSRCFKWICWPR